MKETSENAVPDQSSGERKVFNSGSFSYRTLHSSRPEGSRIPLLPSNSDNQPSDDLLCDSTSESLNLNVTSASLSLMALKFTPPRPDLSSDSFDLSVEQGRGTPTGTPPDGTPTAKKRRTESKPSTPRQSRPDRTIEDFMTRVDRRQSTMQSPLEAGPSNSGQTSATASPVTSSPVTTLLSNVAEIASIENRAADSNSNSPLRERDFKKELENRNRQIQSLQDQLCDAERRHEEQLLQQREIICQLLIQQSKAERKAIRLRSTNDKLRLGYYKPCRVGDHFEDTWHEGEAIAENDAQLEQIGRLIEEKSRRKKRPSVIVKRVEGPAADATDDFQSPDDPEEYKILRQLTEKLRDNEKELQAEAERLEREQNVHVREMRRIKQEDQSRFNDHVVLPTDTRRYLMLSLLGKGGFSEVWRAYDLEKNIYVACKFHRVSKDWREEKKANYVKHVMREKDIHALLKHPRIVPLLDVFTIDNDSFCTVFEHCDGRDLDFYLKQQKQLNEKDAKLVIRQVLSALRYLGEQDPPIIHFDLKPANILMQSSLPGHPSLSENIKITDFGLSKRIETADDGQSIELTSHGTGTYWYLPPEAFLPLGLAKICPKLDVWSLGVIFYQCLYGKKPFGNDLTQNEILKKDVILFAGEVEFPANPKISTAAQDFIRRCLQPHKEYRADVMELLNHELFKRG